MENKPKSLDNTSTSVHFGSLADHSKEKILAPKLVDNRLPQIKEQDTDNDIYDSESSETFPFFNIFRACSSKRGDLFYT